MIYIYIYRCWGGTDAPGEVMFGTTCGSLLMPSSTAQAVHTRTLSWASISSLFTFSICTHERHALLPHVTRQCAVVWVATRLTPTRSPAMCNVCGGIDLVRIGWTVFRPAGGNARSAVARSVFGGRRARQLRRECADSEARAAPARGRSRGARAPVPGRSAPEA